MDISTLYVNLQQLRTLNDKPNAHYLESDYSIKKLFVLLDELNESIPTASLTKQNTSILVDFLADRWSKIKNTDLIYPHFPTMLCNQLCLVLAQHLESVWGKSQYELLMPTIKITYNEISSTELNEHALALHEFVLSDNNDRIIDVLPCLDFAIEDGELKHTSLFNGEPRKLTEREAGRVINHSQLTRDYFQAIRDRLAVKLKGNSLGASLMRLVVALRAGGVHAKADGEELNAGENANEGIYHFAEWLNTLTDKERQDLFVCNAPNISHNIEQIWHRLARPENANYERTIYCVELIANEIEKILEHHPKLFDYYPENKQGSELCLEYLEQRLINTKKQLKSALQSSTYEIKSSYGPQSQERLNVYYAEIIEDLTGLYVILKTFREKDCKIFLQNIQNRLDTLFQNALQLDYFLVHLDTSKTLLLLNAFNENTLDAFVQDTHDFLLAFQHTPESFRPKFYNLIGKKIQKFFVFDGIVGFLPKENRLEFLLNFKEQIVNSIQNGYQLSQLLSRLPGKPAEERDAFVQQIADAIPNIIEDGYQLANVLSWLNQPLDVFTKLMPFFPDIISNINDFIAAFNFVPQDARLSLLSEMGDWIYDQIANGDQLFQLLVLIPQRDRRILLQNIGSELKNIIQISEQLKQCLILLSNKDQHILLEILNIDLKEIMFDEQETHRVTDNLELNIQNRIDYFFKKMNFSPSKDSEEQSKYSKKLTTCADKILHKGKNLLLFLPHVWKRSSPNNDILENKEPKRHKKQG